MSFDPTRYYRLTNRFLGPSQALDVRPDGSGLLKMAPAADVSGQFWNLVPLGNETWALRTWYLGECFSLDVINDGQNRTPRMAASGNFSGQHWRLTPWGDDTYRLTNLFTGPSRSLDTFSDTHALFLGDGNHSGKHWTLTPLTLIPDRTVVLALNANGRVPLTEGTTDFSVHTVPQGPVSAIMVFVDFPDAPAKADAAATGQHLLGNGEAQALYRTQSNGTLTLSVQIMSALGWRRMPKPATSYSFSTFDEHKKYLADAAALFSASEVSLGNRLLFVVAPKDAGFPLSPAFLSASGQGVQTPSGEVRFGVTFGQDSYTNRFINLVHEVGHIFGFPDLYPTGGGADTAKAGCWDLMSDIFHSVSFLGWHRHKAGWLPSERKTYLSRSVAPWFATLSPLSGPCGLSMVVLPIDDPQRPSKVYVVELAQPVLGTTGMSRGEGVLLYTVDATVPTGNSPVVVIPRVESTSPEFGFLFEAPFRVGDAVTHTSGPASITLRVLQKFGSSFNVRIDYARR